MKRSIAPSTNLVLSLRDMGYTLDTALADVIDNSISSGATRVEIMAPPTSPLRVTITDNGHGITERDLLNALTLAYVSPDAVRLSADLGRYGMGMKTASWSQCKRLTIVSSIDNVRHGATIDLDDIRLHEQWTTEVLSNAEIDALPDAACLPTTGTMLIWEKLDRLVNESDEKATQDLASKLNQAAAHLELVFHRFMAHETGHPQIEIWLNGRQLQPYDPFSSKHPATQRLAEETIRLGAAGDVRVQAFTLPHHSKLSVEENTRQGGPDGYLKNQGFYLYREGRLILWGTWFRLTKHHPSLNLSRIRVDIPNTMDDEWHINILKASAQPPRKVRDRLKQIIDALGSPSRRIYSQRGYLQEQGGLYPVWLQRQSAGRISYELSDTHPLVSKFRAGLDPAQQRDFRALIQLIASAIPLDAITVSLSNAPGNVGGGAIDEDGLSATLDSIWERSRSVGMDADELLEALSVYEPFRSNIEFATEYLGKKSEQ